jgi:hypothetical protein
VALLDRSCTFSNDTAGFAVAAQSRSTSMIPYKWPVATAVPQNLEARFEIAKAIPTLAGADDEALRQRRAEIASIRNELEAIGAEFSKLRRDARSLISSALHKYGYNPDEPRVPKHNTGGGQWTKGDPEIAQLGNGPLSSLVPRETTGISQIDDVTDKLHKILNRVMNSLARLPGQPQKYGIIVHTAFALAVATAGIRGISPLDVERSFSLPPDYGANKESVRPDLVLRNDIGDIIAIYDVKTGDATIDPWRARELRAATRVGLDVPIIVLHPYKVTFKARYQTEVSRL